ncbi:hypothetical protein [Brevibacterium sediminis]
MKPGHEDCAHELVDEKVLCEREARATIICLHDHRVPVHASDGLMLHAVGFHCHCCGNVWNSRDYIERGPHA